jgi:hypothetical protein
VPRAAVGIGVTGVDARTRLRVGVIFGLFETAMPTWDCCWATAWLVLWAIRRTELARPC